MKKDIENESSHEDVNYTVRDLKIEEIVPNVIDDFLVTIIDNHHTLILPSTITGLQLRSWENGRGGIFSKDVLQYALNKYKENYERTTPLAQYVHIKGDAINAIVRLISEEELFSFSTLKLVDGKIKDISYMILRYVKDDDVLTSNKKLIGDKDIYTEPEIITITSSTTSNPEEDVDYHGGSISLFNE